jgi:hypothetical protein
LCRCAPLARQAFNITETPANGCIRNRASSPCGSDYIFTAACSVFRGRVDAGYRRAGCLRLVPKPSTGMPRSTARRQTALMDARNALWHPCAEADQSWVGWRGIRDLCSSE